MKNVMMAFLTLATAAGLISAQTPAPAFTRVKVEGMDCMGCAKKINKKVMAVPGVAEMRVDLKSRTIWAIHRPGQTPSARAIWEAIERADHTPTRMDTPSGSHTARPTS